MKTRITPENIKDFFSGRVAFFQGLGKSFYTGTLLTVVGEDQYIIVDRELGEIRIDKNLKIIQ
jgi:hypothetical protein